MGSQKNLCLSNVSKDQISVLLLQFAGKVLLQKRKKGTLLLAGFPNPVVFQNRLR